MIILNTESLYSCLASVSILSPFSSVCLLYFYHCIRRRHDKLSKLLCIFIRCSSFCIDENIFLVPFEFVTLNTSHSLGHLDNCSSWEFGKQSVSLVSQPVCWITWYRIIFRFKIKSHDAEIYVIRIPWENSQWDNLVYNNNSRNSNKVVSSCHTFCTVGSSVKMLTGLEALEAL